MGEKIKDMCRQYASLSDSEIEAIQRYIQFLKENDIFLTRICT